MRIKIVFVTPPGRDDSWTKGGRNWREAQNIPDAEIVVDHGGIEAHRYGAHTSGQAYLFSSEEQLVFQGGITASRGHQGDSEGRSAILRFVQDGLNRNVKTRVFGCALLRAESLSEAGHEHAS